MLTERQGPGLREVGMGLNARSKVVLAVLVGGLICSLAPLSAAPFIRGDANQDGRHDVADAITALGYLFQGEKTTCADALDVNDDGKVDIADPIALLGYLFSAAPPPAQPFPTCGEDPTSDPLSCSSFARCAPPPELVVTAITPNSGPAEGDTLVVITGKGFSGTGLSVRLCGRALVGLRRLSDTRLEGRTPPGEPGRLCDLVVSNEYGTVTLRDAFLYEQPPPPECLTEDDLAQIIDQYLGEPTCLPSPVWEGTLLGQNVIVCPEGCCTCADGTPGCEAVLEDVQVEVDIPGETAHAQYTGSASVPIKVGGTTCETDITVSGSVGLQYTLSETQWEGVLRIESIDDLQFSIENVTVDSRGGFVCLFLEGAGGAMRGILEDELNARKDQFIASMEEELVGKYVCP